MKKIKRFLAILLTLCMVIAGLNMSSFTTVTAEAASTGGTLDTEEFPTMVLIDCGRGYYSVENIESIIDTMSDNGYQYLMLGFGNDGLRFVLDDMSVTVNGTTYASDTVKNAVISANDTLQNNNGSGQWTEDDMDKIIGYASTKGIGIVPMLNCPGHAYSMYKAVAAATGITNIYTAYGSSGTVDQYNYSIDLSNETVKGFVEGLVEKYIAYFADKGCKFFNFGCDESKYDTSQTVTYLNDVCATMPTTMVPMAFCDILKGANGGYPSNLVGIDWDGGNLGSSHYHINANDNWYYVLGNSENSDGWSTYYRSLNRTKTIDVTTTIGGEDAYGSILAIWNDSYLASSSYITNIQNLIKSQATASVNDGYFKVTKKDSATNITVTAVGLTGLTVEKLETPAYSETGKQVIGYNITPAGYTQGASATVTIPVPNGWSGKTISVYDVTNSKTVESTTSNGVITFTVTHFSEWDLVTDAADAGDSSTETTTKEVTVAVGGTYTDTLTGSQTKTTDSNTSIATVATESKEVSGTWSASASASIGAYTSSYSADNLIDGSTSTMYWSGDNQSKGAYVRVDLGIDQKISAIRVTPYDTSADSYCTANVQVSTDGTNWTTVGTYDGTKTTTVTFDETTARYIQVVITTAKSNWWKVAEIEWGTATTKTTADSYDEQSVTLSRNNYSNYIGYYYKSGNSYYQITNITRSTNTGSSIYYTISYNGTSTDVQTKTEITLYTKTSGSSTTTFTACAKSGTGSSTTNTVVTINGVKVGDTTAVVGNTTYNIHVVAEDVSGVTLTYYPFLADYPVYPEGTGTSNCGKEASTNPQTLNASAKDVNTESGADISTIAWAEGDWLWEGDSVQTELWKGVLHTVDSNKQIQDGEVVSSDKSLDGIDFTYIRYYNGTWAVSADRVTWTEFDSSSDEICVYYLQKTAITDEVTTYVKDWAFTTADTSSWYSKDHKALSFSVVYPDGQMSPAADSIYSDSTLIYWYDTGAKSDSPTMMIRIGVNEIYKVSKVTWTLGTMTNPTSSSSTNGSLTWNTTIDEDGNTWYDETTCWTSAEGSDPAFETKDFVAGYDKDKGSIIYNTYNTANSALLILIYLEPVQTEDSLTVKYVDDSSNTEFLNYAVNVTNTSTDEKGTFLNRLKQTSTVQAGEFTLDDDAFVTNAKGTNETFQKDLTQIPSLMGTSYGAGFYKYVKAEISEDGKTLTLHYNIKDDSDTVYNAVKYVVDFGLSIKIPISDLGIEASSATISVSDTKYGKTEVSDDNKYITYTPDETLKSIDVFKVYFKFADSTQSKTIRIYPATTVYYEEGFATYSTSWTGNASTGSGTQTKTLLGAETNVFGYDDAYDSVEASAGTQATSSAKNDTATFSFTGTGVDIYANSTTETGRLFIQIKQDGSTVKMAQVDTIMKNGESDATKSGQDVTGYNIPVYSITDLAHGTYDVTITHVVDEGKETASAVNLDGFRVYNTLSDSSVFDADNEDNPDFIELRNQVLVTYGVKGTSATQTYTSDESTDETVAIVSNTADYSADTVNDLLTNGPKNEIYLQPNQALTFKVKTNRQVELGLKALNKETTYTLNDGNAVTLSTSTDMFYKILDKANASSEQQIVIKNTGSGILAITKLKVCDEAATLEPLTEEDINNAVAAINGETEQEALAITKQPVSVESATGKTVEFSVEATGTDLTYQWQYSKNGTKWYTSGMTGAKTDTLSVKALETRNGQMYRCVITDASGATVTSDVATLTIAVAKTLKITSQPESYVGALNGTATFNVVVEGEGLTYQWQYSKNGTKWYNSSSTGATTDTLLIKAIKSRNGQMYRCVVIDANGEKVTSDVATITIQ